jgi:hypothetical protein
MKKILIFAILISAFIGCGGTSSKKKSINMADYFPNTNSRKSFYKIKDSGDNNLYDENIVIDKNVITIKVKDVIKKVITINDSTIVQLNSDDNLTRVMERSIKEGEILYTLPKSTTIKDIKIEDTILGHETIESTKICRLERKLTKLEKYDIKYRDNILKFRCIEDKSIVTKVKDNLPDYINLTNGEKKSDYDISYFYMKKGVGLIVEINDDCITTDRDGIKRVNDSTTKCVEKHYTHTFFLE